MAITIYQGSTTRDTVIIQVDGLDSNYPSKAFDVYLDGNYYNTYTTTTASSYASFIIGGLSQGTSYTCNVRAFCDYGGGDWRPDPATNQNTGTIVITTSGGSGGVSATYTVSASGNNVIIDLYNTDQYYDVYFYLYDSPSSSTSIRDSGLIMDTATYQFSGLSNGTYYVEVKYQKYNTSTWTFLQNRNTGYTRSPITVGGSPVTTGGYAYIFTGSEWKKAKPYIFDGSQWKPASPYIFNGSQWKPAIE